MEAALAASWSGGAAAASVLQVGEAALIEIVKQLHEGNLDDPKLAAVLPANVDTEQQALSVLLDWLEPALVTLFGNACLGTAPEFPLQRRLLVGLLRINTIEVFSLVVLAALIVSDRTNSTSSAELPHLLDQPGFEVSLSAAVSIVSLRGGGQGWRQQQFKRWKVKCRQPHANLSERGGGGRATVGCRVCWGCAGPTLKGASRLLCNACKFAVYCSPDCQKKDWKFCHKRVCTPLRAHRCSLNVNHNEEEDGMGLEMGAMIASTYYKWKTGKSYWMPFTYGHDPFPHYRTNIDILDSLEQPRDSATTTLERTTTLESQSAALQAELHSLIARATSAVSRLANLSSSLSE
jgi:hypothetical protein